jgi:hypothetical protein
MKRYRKVDLNDLDEVQLMQVENLLSAKVSEVVSKAVAEANEFLNVYGIQARMIMELSPKEKGANLKDEEGTNVEEKVNG